MPIWAYYAVPLTEKTTPKQSPEDKPIVWMGSSKKDLDSLSEDLQDMFGYALGLAQQGGTHPDAKLMKGSLRDVVEVIANEDTDTYRAMYSVRLKGMVYVLHVFKKKSKTGRATPKADLDLIEQRYKAAKEHYRKYIEDRE